MKDECKKYISNTIMRDEDGTEYSSQIINCSECPNHIACEGEEKIFELIVGDGIDE